MPAWCQQGVFATIDRPVPARPRVACPPRSPQGTYFTTVDIQPLGYDDGREFCLALPEMAGVVAIPSQVFYTNKHAGKHLVRFAFCKQDSMLDEAVDRLAVLRAS